MSRALHRVSRNWVLFSVISVIFYFLLKFWKFLLVLTTNSSRQEELHYGCTELSILAPLLFWDCWSSYNESNNYTILPEFGDFFFFYLKVRPRSRLRTRISGPVKVQRRGMEIGRSVNWSWTRQNTLTNACTLAFEPHRKAAPFSDVLHGYLVLTEGEHPYCWTTQLISSE